MVRVRTLVLLVVVLAFAALAATASAQSTMTARYKGTVRTVSVARHAFSLKLKSGVVRIYTNEMTHYHGITSFMGIHKGQHLKVRATERASDHTWWATSIAVTM